MRFFVLVATLFVTINIYSQNSLQGTIRDKSSGEAIPGAVIYFPDLKSGAVSKEDGSYQVNNLPKIKNHHPGKDDGLRNVY